MPWVPRISPKEDEEVEAPASKATEKAEKASASRAQSEKALSFLVTRGADLWLDLQSRKLSGKKLTKYLTDDVYDEIRKRLQNPKKPDRPCWYFNVDVSATELTADGLQILVSFLKRLFEADPPVCVHSLRCYNNDLGDAGAEQIAELILAQPFAMAELHLSHSRLTELGAAKVILAVCVCADRYPFQRKHRWTGCWMRLESNHVVAPDALVTAMRAALLPGRTWSEKTVRIESIARGDRTWGRAHGPSWATSAEATPQALLYTFHEQVDHAGYGTKETASGIRAARRATEAAREAVLNLQKKLNGDEVQEEQAEEQSSTGPTGVVVPRWRRAGEDGGERDYGYGGQKGQKGKKGYGEGRGDHEKGGQGPEARLLRKAVQNLHQTEPRTFRDAAASSHAWSSGSSHPWNTDRSYAWNSGSSYTSSYASPYASSYAWNSGKVSRVVTTAYAPATRHDNHEYANAIGSGIGKGGSAAARKHVSGSKRQAHRGRSTERGRAVEV
ncbi:yvdB [Symbiodinium pilosum]|uniref:YvdB protein n=1 Tax=Symbiodinium pilosum TaxID=2952 RepID=A0A812QLY4_SYMPI|nr:yvdB [Symbiodinium pilosum]